MAHLAARRALVDLARVKAGERVLVHSATGGVGHGALQLCAQLGAEVYATAGTPEKRDYLRRLGIGHVMPSRSLTWADEVLERTGGEGVDVVLNSLARRRRIGKGLEVLRPYGRFVEIGKRDIAGDSQVGSRPCAKSLAFFGGGSVAAVARRPARKVGDALRRLAADVEAGASMRCRGQGFDRFRRVRGVSADGAGTPHGEVAARLPRDRVALRPQHAAPRVPPRRRVPRRRRTGGLRLARSPPG